MICFVSYSLFQSQALCFIKERGLGHKPGLNLYIIQDFLHKPGLQTPGLGDASCPQYVFRDPGKSRDPGNLGRA